MQFGSTSFGSVSLGSIEQDPGASNVEALTPIVTELNGVNIRTSVKVDTIRIVDTVGQPVTASFILRDLQPQVGDRVRIRYFSQVIFAGTIEHVNRTTDALSVIWYAVDCLDWSQILLRRRIRRNFTNLPIINILDSLLDNELAGEGLSIGIIDTGVTMPMVDSRGGKAFDVVRQMAGATGQTFYMDYDLSIQMRSTTSPVAPFVLNQTNTLLDASSLMQDRETYRNKQVVIVTGTVPEGGTGDALTVTVERQNDDQIAARAEIEGGTGLYEEIEEVTHPTSNDGVQLALLGIGYANLRLATSGTPRVTFKCSALGYGFRAGQIATADLASFGVSGTFVIQRVSIREKIGSLLFHDLDLASSSLQQRAYEAWLSMVKAGKVTVQVPSSTTNNLQSFTAPGADVFVVPADVVLLEITCYGGSGSGGGGARQKAFGISKYANGGKGGNSGKAVSVVAVTPGETLTVIVGSAGAPGGTSRAQDETFVPAVGGNGVAGTVSQAKRSVTVLCQGDGGGRGTGGYQDWAVSGTSYNGSDGSSGSGVGDAVSVGGGKIGGAKGTGNPLVSGQAGQDGLVEFRW